MGLTTAWAEKPAGQESSPPIASPCPPCHNALMLTRRALLGGFPLLAAAQRRPNVLVFMSDQETALLPGPVNAPNHRRLDREGVRFTHAFCNTPQCSPA